MVYDCGVGYHQTVVLARDPSQLVNYAKSLIAVETIYCTAVVFPKLSLLGLYCRLFPNKKTYCYLAYGLMAMLALNGIAGDVTSLTSCRPLAKRWNSTLDGECINVTYFWRWISLANIITDTAMLVLPLPIVWQLHASRSQKINLTILLLTGSFGLISSIIRFKTFFDNQAFVDGTWASVDLMAWTSIEPGIYLIAACLPNLRPIWVHFKSARRPTVTEDYALQAGSGSSSKGSRYVQLEKGSHLETTTTATSATF